MKHIASTILMLLSTAAVGEYPIRLDRLAPSDAQPSDVIALDQGGAHVVLDLNALNYRGTRTAYSFAVDFNTPSPVTVGQAFWNPSPSIPATSVTAVAGGSLWLYAAENSLFFSPPPPLVTSGVLGLTQNATVQLRQQITVPRSGRLIQIGDAVFEVQPNQLKPMNGTAVNLALCDNGNCFIQDFLGTSQAGYALRRQRLDSGAMRLELVRFNTNAQITQVLPLLTASTSISGTLDGEGAQLQLLISSSSNQLNQNYLLTIDEGAQAQITAASVLPLVSSKRYLAVRARDWLQIDTSTNDTNYTLMRANLVPALTGLSEPQVKFSRSLPSNFYFAEVEGSPLGDIVIRRTQGSSSRVRNHEHHWLREDGTQIATSFNWQAVDFTGSGNLLVAEKTTLAGQQRTQVLVIDRNAQVIQPPRLLADVNMTVDTAELTTNAAEELVSFQTYPTSTSTGRAMIVLKHSNQGNSTLLAELSPRLELAHELRAGLTHAFVATPYDGAATQIQRVNLQNGQLDAPRSPGIIVSRAIPIGAEALVAVQTVPNSFALSRFDGQNFLPIAVPSPFVPGLIMAATPEHPTDVARFVGTADNTTRVFALNAVGEVRTVFDLPPDRTAQQILDNGAVNLFGSDVAGNYLMSPDGVQIELPQNAAFGVSDRRGGYWTNVWIGRNNRVVHTRSSDGRTTLGPSTSYSSSFSNSDVLSDGDLVIINPTDALVHRYRVYENGTILQRTVPLIASGTLSADHAARLSYEFVPSSGGQLRDMTSIQAYALPIMPARTDYLFADGLE